MYTIIVQGKILEFEPRSRYSLYLLFARYKTALSLSLAWFRSRFVQKYLSLLRCARTAIVLPSKKKRGLKRSSLALHISRSTLLFRFN